MRTIQMLVACVLLGGSLVHAADWFGEFCSFIDGKVGFYSVSIDGRIKAYDADANARWDVTVKPHLETHGGPGHGLADAVLEESPNGKYLGGCLPGTLVVLNAEDGTVLFREDDPKVFLLRAAWIDDTRFVHLEGLSDKIVCRNWEGKRLWEIPDRVVMHSLLTQHGKVFAQMDVPLKNVLCCFDRNGEKKWTVELHRGNAGWLESLGPGPEEGSITCVSLHGDLHTISSDGKIIAFSKIEDLPDLLFTPPAHWDRGIAMSLTDGRAIAFSTRVGKHMEVRFPVNPRPSRSELIPPIGLGERVAFCKPDKRTIALYQLDGTHLRDVAVNPREEIYAMGNLSGNRVWVATDFKQSGREVKVLDLGK